MIPHPLLYLFARRLRNRVRFGFSMLRRPKVLIGMIVFIAYAGMVLSMMLISQDPGREPPFLKEGAVSDLIVPMSMLAFAMGAWIFLGWGKLHPLGFEKAEVELLFPLPVQRKALVAYRLLAAQPRVTFTSVLMMLFISRSASPLSFLGWLVLVNVAYLHVVIISFAHGTPRSAGSLRVALAWLPGLALFIAVATAVARSGLQPDRLLSIESFSEEILRISESPAIAFILTPFRLFTRLIRIGADSSQSLPDLLQGLGILAAHVGWIFVQDHAFEEASLRSAEVRAARLASFKKGRLFPTWQKRGPVLSQPFRLAPTGPPIWAFAWKGLLAAGRRYSGRNAILGASLCVGLGIGIRIAAQTQESDVWIMVIRSIGGMIVWTLYSFILFGPSPEGFGLIESMALLKPLPIRGPTVFLGSMLAEVSKAMFVFFLLWSAGAGFSSDWLQQNPMVGVGLLVTSFAAMMLLVAVASAVRLAVVLWLPFTATFETGPTAIGHNLLIFALRILPIVGLLLAPVGFSVGAAMLMKSFAYAIPISLGLGVMILACEIVPIVMLGGWLYDRFDLVQDSRTFA